MSIYFPLGKTAAWVCMMDSDVEDEMGNDSDVLPSDDDELQDDRKLSKLVDAVSSLDRKNRSKVTQRSIPTEHVSEFTFKTASDGSKVKLHELMGALHDTTSHGHLKKQIHQIQKRGGVVPVPLPRGETEKIERSTSYAATSKEVSKWDPVVTKNRLAEQMKFPLAQPDLRVLTTTEEFTKRFQPRTSLEVEVAALLRGGQHVVNVETALTPAEERAVQSMTVEEAKERRAELQKYRALMSYKEAKIHRQNKIKSKTYHRHLRKSRQKKEASELEDLQKRDPEAFMEKMKEVEKTRIKERMSLKHRGGSKFAQQQKLYSKYNEEARQAIQDMNEKSRQLTKKSAIVEESDSDGDSHHSNEDDPDPTHHVTSQPGEDNPWMTVVRQKRKAAPEVMPNPVVSVTEERVGPVVMETKTFEECDVESEPEDTHIVHVGSQSEGNIGDVELLFDKFEEQRTVAVKDVIKEKQTKGKRKKSEKLKKKTKKKSKLEEKEDEQCDKDEYRNEGLISESLTKKRTLEDIENDSDWSDDNVTSDLPTRTSQSELSTDKTVKENQDDVSVDPNKIFTVDTKLTGHKDADIVVDEDEDEDNDEIHQRLLIEQAFADDDVVEEFVDEKKRITERDQPRDLDLFMPGWGDWGGAGVLPDSGGQKKKRRKFIIKAPPLERRDYKLGHVIISEKKNDTIRKHQVSSLPFPYTNVEQFERSIRAPVGKLWNPETAFKSLTRPKVVTRLGQIIAPIDKGEVFEKQKVDEPGARRTVRNKDGKKGGNAKTVSAKVKRLRK